MRQMKSTYTNPEQSKLLLKIGVPAESADIALLRTPDGQYDPYFIGSDTKLRRKVCTGEALPSWSVGRLIEISYICWNCEVVDWSFKIYDGDNIIGYIVIDMTLYVSHEMVDFSKLT